MIVFLWHIINNMHFKMNIEQFWVCIHSRISIIIYLIITVEYHWHNSRLVMCVRRMVLWCIVGREGKGLATVCPFIDHASKSAHAILRQCSHCDFENNINPQFSANFETIRKIKNFVQNTQTPPVTTSPQHRSHTPSCHNHPANR